MDKEHKTLAVHILKDKNYITQPYTDEDTAPIHILENNTINLAEVFAE